MDDRCGVITAIETTPGDVDEPKRTTSLLDQHEAHTNQAATTVVADQQYGTNANYRDLQKRGVRTHMGRLFGAGHSNNKGIFGAERFSYDARANHYTCPAGQILYPRRRDARRQATEYTTRKGVCVSCPMLAQCTRSKRGRTLMRHDDQELIDLARTQAASPQARRDRARRRHVGEGSFAHASRHHFKRARWRRLWRQQIQDWLIAAIQNIKTLLAARPSPPSGVSGTVLSIYHDLIGLLGAHLKQLTKIVSRIWIPSPLT